MLFSQSDPGIALRCASPLPLRSSHLYLCLDHNVCQDLQRMLIYSAHRFHIIVSWYRALQRMNIRDNQQPPPSSQALAPLRNDCSKKTDHYEETTKKADPCVTNLVVRHEDQLSRGTSRRSHSPQGPLRSLQMPNIFSRYWASV